MIYRSYKKAIVTTCFFVIILVSSWVIFHSVGQSLVYIAGTLGFTLAAVIMFEFQKNTLSRSLADRVLPGKGNNIFIYDNGITKDIFENILVVGSGGIVICTCYLPAQRGFNRFLHKESILEIIMPSSIKFVQVDKELKEIEIATEYKKFKIEMFNKITQLESTLLENGYTKINNKYMPQF